MAKGTRPRRPYTVTQYSAANCNRSLQTGAAYGLMLNTVSNNSANTA